MALKSTERRVDELELNKQDTLVSGVTIKTINGNSVLGSGNLTVGGSVAWGSITGTLSDQTDLQTALNAKQNTLISGTNIKTINGNTLLGSGDITVGGGITVGTTAVTSGTDGSVFFQSGGVVQQDSSFFWDNTNKRLILGTTGINGELQINRSTGGTNIGGVRANSAGSGAEIGGANNYTNKILLHNAQGIHFFTGTNTSDSSEKMRITTGTSWGLVIGATTNGARLDVRAQGALSTDIAFRVRNSADTGDLFSVLGNSSIIIGGSTASITDELLYLNGQSLANTQLVSVRSLANQLLFQLSNNYNFRIGANANNIAYNGTAIRHSTSGWHAFNTSTAIGTTAITPGTSRLMIYAAGTARTDVSLRIREASDQLYFLGNSNLLIGDSTTNADGDRVFAMKNGTAPSANMTDYFKLYSADIVAGNAAPHFRTENGSIIKLFKGAALTASDGTLANAVTRIAELEARLQAHGLIA